MPYEVRAGKWGGLFDNASKWHRLSVQGAFKDAKMYQEFRKELAVL